MLNNLIAKQLKYQDPDVGVNGGKDTRQVVRLDEGGHGVEEQVPAVGACADHH